MIDTTNYNLINRGVLIEILNKEVYKLFDLNFTEFEWKQGKMYKMSNGENTIISTCFDSGRTYFMLKFNYQSEKFYEEYVSIGYLTVNVDAEKYSTKDIQKKLLNALVNIDYSERHLEYVLKIDDVPLYPTYPLSFSQLITNGESRKDLKMYNIKNLNVRDFGSLCSVLEDLSIIPMYLSDEVY